MPLLLQMERGVEHLASDESGVRTWSNHGAVSVPAEAWACLILEQAAAAIS
jgi:hypothetical protein